MPKRVKSGCRLPAKKLLQPVYRNLIGGKPPPAQRMLFYCFRMLIEKARICFFLPNEACFTGKKMQPVLRSSSVG